MSLSGRCLFVICLFTATKLCAQEPLPSYLPSSGLVAWYPFNGDAVNTLDPINQSWGTLFGPTPTTDRFNHLNRAFLFDGIDDYIRGSGVTYPVNARTISMWFSLDDITNHHMLVNYGGTTCGTSFLSGINYPGIFTASHCSVKDVVATDPTIIANKWYNLIITSGGGKTRFYIDGGLLIDTAIDYSGMSFAPFFAFGVSVTPDGGVPYADANVDYLKGKLDDIGIWDRVLTPQEVQQVYLAGEVPVPGASLDLDGSNDFVEVAYNPLLSLKNFTLETWVKTTASDDFARLISKPDAGGQNYSLILHRGRPSVRFDGISLGALFVESATAINDGNWHHVSGVFSQGADPFNSTLKLYIDGAEVANKEIDPRIIPVTSTESLFLGRYGFESGGLFMRGTMDEVRIWNIARTQAEIQASMNCEITSPQPGLVANYHFNQGIGGGNNTAVNALIDASGNNNTGTLYNFALSSTASNWLGIAPFSSGSTCRAPAISYYRDIDGDGYGDALKDSLATAQPAGYVLDKTDCDDSNSNVHPGATEICDGKDNNCDGIIDNILGITPGVTGNTAVCIGSTLLLKAKGGTNYQWTGPGGFTATTDSIAINNIQPTDSGNYTVIITGNCTPDTITTHVFVLSPPKAVISGLNNSYCLNDPAAVLTGLPAGGVFSGPGITGNIFTPGTVGTATISYISQAYYGCPADTTTMPVIVNSLPLVSISSSGATALCSKDTLTLTANTTAAIFTWNTGATNSTIKVGSAGIYTVKVTDAAGCSKESVSVQIVKDPVIKIISNSGSIICTGDALQLSFPASNVLWNTGETTSTISPAPTASSVYYVRGTSANGCSYQDSIAITVNPNLPPDRVSNMFPPDRSVNLIYPFTLSWIPGKYSTSSDVAVWKAVDSPSTAIQMNNIQGVSVSTPQGLTAGTPYKWQVISRNGSCASTKGPVQTFTLRYLPDLIVQNIKLPATAIAGQKTTAGWQIKNIGTGSTGAASWIEKIYLSANTTIEGFDPIIGTRLNYSALEPGRLYNDSVLIKIPPSLVGNYYLIIQTNAYQSLTESDESNNQAISVFPINITLPPLPDLRVTSVAAQTNVLSGSRTNVYYTIKNFGDTAVRQAITNNFYIIDNAILPDTNSIQPVKRETTLISLLPGESVTIQSNDSVPINIAGKYYVHVLVDAGGDVFEGTGENNNSNSDSITVILVPPADLALSDLKVPDTLFNNQMVNVSYVLKNQGFAPTGTILFFDAVFLSRDSILDFATAIPLCWVFHIDIKQLAIYGTSVANPCLGCKIDSVWEVIYLVGPSGTRVFYCNTLNSVIGSGGLNAGENRNYNFQFLLPDTLTGNFNIFVLTDIANDIFEYNHENNNILRRGDFISDFSGPGYGSGPVYHGTATQPVNIINPDLSANNVVLPAVGNAGFPLTVQWVVKNNGPAPVSQKKRKDAVYLSSSSSFDPANCPLTG